MRATGSDKVSRAAVSLEPCFWPRTRAWQDAPRIRRHPRTSVRSEKRVVPKVCPLGDTALLVALSETLDPDANRRARRLARKVKARRLGWMTDVVPALVTVAIHFAAATVAVAAERSAAIERLGRGVGRVSQGEG